jgi:prophage maintenance system killer protein
VLQDEHIDRLDTIVKTIYGKYFGFNRFPTDEEKAAVFLTLIIKDHPVVDGNKRLSVLWLQVFCEVHNLKIISPIPLDELAVSIENTKDISINELYYTVRFLLFGPNSILDR